LTNYKKIINITVVRLIKMFF